jgi:hypothetical protein
MRRRANGRGDTFYPLLPVVMMFFVWKATVFPLWGLGLLCVAAAVIVSHGILPLGRISRRAKIILSVGAGVVVTMGAMLVPAELRTRHFDLRHANLPDQWLAGQDLRGAGLSYAKERLNNNCCAFFALAGQKAWPCPEMRFT